MLPETIYKIKIDNKKRYFDMSRFRNFDIRKYRYMFIVGALMVITLIFFIWPDKSTEDAKILGKMSKTMVLPDESPVTAVVNDPESLKNNIFFKGAKKGDRIFLFEKAGKAVLYSIEFDKILNAGTIGESGIQIK